MPALKPAYLHVVIALCWIVAASPAAAQLRTTINGRVEDAATLQPLPGIRITAGDSATSTLTRLDGTFAIEVAADGPLLLYVEGFGYEFQEFDLPPESVGRIAVLRLEPAPLALAGIDVVADQKVDILLGNLLNRRRGFAEGPSSGFDRLWLERFGPFGVSVLAFVRQRNPWIRVCPTNPSALCVPSRVRTITYRESWEPVLVCIDGWRSLAPIDELEGMSIESVSLVEFFDRSRVHVYTPLWILSRVRSGRTTVAPLVFGC